jgi:hypothetical protein
MHPILCNHRGFKMYGNLRSEERPHLWHAALWSHQHHSRRHPAPQESLHVSPLTPCITAACLADHSCTLQHIYCHLVVRAYIRVEFTTAKAQEQSSRSVACPSSQRCGKRNICSSARGVRVGGGGSSPCSASECNYVKGGVKV